MRVFVSKSVWLPGRDKPCPCTIEVTNGKIAAIHESVLKSRSDYGGQLHAEDGFVDCGDKWLLPGLVDAHVHLNEPGRTEWEGFATGTAAAASGGCTTVVDMPLNAIPPTTTVANLHEKLAAAQGQCRVDVAFWGGVIPGNENDLVPLAKEGVKGFKCFLIESGVDEFPCVNEEQVLTAMPKLAEADSLFLFHAELDTGAGSDASQAKAANPEDYSTFLDSRPDTLETSAISLISRCAEKHPSVRTHIVHLSAASALPIIRTARRDKQLPMTVETCFHYLTLASEHVPRGSTLHKCCPPIRSDANRDALWRALVDGDIDFVVSDHSPCTTELKRLETGDFMGAWGGIGGLGLGLSLMWTETRRRGIGMDRIIEWCATRPAKQVRLDHQKGAIKLGNDADFVVFDPEARFTVDKSELHFKNRASPYEGMQLTGAVCKTFLRGQKVYDRSAGQVGKPLGQLLL